MIPCLSVIFDNYFESLDPNKSYFLQSDIDYFEKYRYTIDDHLPEGNLDFAYQVFSIYREAFIGAYGLHPRITQSRAQLQ